jgi:hypothetical protein
MEGLGVLEGLECRGEELAGLGGVVGDGGFLRRERRGIRRG